MIEGRSPLGSSSSSIYPRDSSATGGEPDSRSWGEGSHVSHFTEVRDAATAQKVKLSSVAHPPLHTSSTALSNQLPVPPLPSLLNKTKSPPLSRFYPSLPPC